MTNYPMAEEKEKHTLRVLMTSSISSLEYFTGSLLPSLLIVEAANIILVPVAKVSFHDVHLASFLILSTIMSIICLLLGNIVGIFVKNQTQAGIISMPFMLGVVFIPMLGMYNDVLGKISDYTFVGVFTNYMTGVLSSKGYQWNVQDIIVLLAWFLICLGLFIFFYKRNGLDRD